MSATLYLWIFAVNKINCLNLSRNFWCKVKILDIFKMFITKSLHFFTPFIFRTLHTVAKYKQFLNFFIIELNIFELVLSPSLIFCLSSDSFVFLNQICPKGEFQSKTEKVNITTEFSIFELVLDAKFHLKQTILSFCTKFVQKRYFPYKAG